MCSGERFLFLAERVHTPAASGSQRFVLPLVKDADTPAEQHTYMGIVVHNDLFVDIEKFEPDERARTKSPKISDERNVVDDTEDIAETPAFSPG